MASITIGVQSLLNTATYDSYTLSNASTVSTLKNFIASNASVSAAWYQLYFNNELLANANTLSSYGITANSQIRTANRIGHLPSREDRQLAKLDLAALDRTASGNSRNTYDITELPTQYYDNGIINNPNTGGLVTGRPWFAPFIGMDDPANAAESDATAWVLMDGPFYNTPGNPDSGFVGGQSWRKMAPAAPVNGKTSYVYGDESVNWTGSVWQYTNTSIGVISSSTDNVAFPWLATWTNGFTAAKITGTYVKTTNYPAVP